jgi:hypothetical protein
MLALAVVAENALGAAALQQPNTDAQWELINAYHDGRLWILVIVIVIVAMLVKQRRKIG